MSAKPELREKDQNPESGDDIQFSDDAKSERETNFEDAEQKGVPKESTEAGDTSDDVTFKDIVSGTIAWRLLRITICFLIWSEKLVISRVWRIIW